MNRLAKFLLAMALIWTFPLTAYAAPVGKFTSVQGTVDVTSRSGSTELVRAGFPVNIGDIIRTKSRSGAEILFEDGSVMRLARNSRIAIDEYAMGGEKDRGIFKLFRGKVQSIVEKAAGLFATKRTRFEIHTPTAVAGVRGTNFFTWYNQGTSGVAVREGTVYNYAANKPNQVREVRAGQSSIVVSADEDPVVGTATDAELTLDEEEEGSPSAFLGEPDEDPFVPAEETETLVTKDNTEEVVPAVSGTATPDFELQLAGGFLTGTLTGDNGELTLSGTYDSEAAANAMAADGDLSNGGELEGSLSGVLGSWEGLFNSIYADPDGGAGFIYGTLSGDVTGSQLSATGPMTKTAALGTVADPAADLELETLYRPAAIVGTPGADPMVAGLLTANIDTGADRWLGIFSLTSTDTGYTPLAASAYYGLANSGTYSGVDASNNPADIPYLLVGYVNMADDQAGHIQLTDQGNLFYIDPLYHGTYDVSYRGAYDGEGNLSLAGSGMFVLDPLDYSGFWGGDGTVFYNDNGYAGVAATDFGLMGLVASATGHDFYAAGDYFLTGAASETDPFVWGTTIGGEDMTGSGDFLGGWTAGAWRYTTNSYGLPGGMDGAAAALKASTAGGLVTVEQLSGDLIGEYFTAPLGYEESDGLFRVRDDQGLNVTSFTAAEGDLELVSGGFSQALSGLLGASGTIQGYGGGSLTVFRDTSTGQGLGAFSLGLNGIGPGLTSLDLGYGGNAYAGRGRGAQNFTAKTGGGIDYSVESWSEIGSAEAIDGFGYYLTDMNGTLNADGNMTAGLAGTLMTQTFIADMSGSVFGQGADGEIVGDGTWIGQGVGTLDNLAPLAFSGIIDYADDWDLGPYYGLFSEYDGYLDTWGDVYALAGSTVSPWRYNGTRWVPQATDVLILGETYEASDTGRQYIWNDELYSWNAVEGNDTTYDGGSFNGFVGGVFNGGRIDGRAVTLYMDPDGNAGLMTGAADGQYFSDIAMMRADGIWTPIQMAAAADLEILPENLYDAVHTDATMQASAVGDFAGSGHLRGASVPFGDYEYDSLAGPLPDGGYGGGWTRFIDGQNWGVYDFILSGYEDDGGGYENSGGATSWKADVGGTAVFGSVEPEIAAGEAGPSLAEFTLDEGYWLGSVTAGSWSGGVLEGDLNGTYLTRTHLGSIDGEVFGYYDGAGNWAATSLGTFDGVPLSFASSFDYGGYSSGIGAMPTTIFHARKYYQAQYANPSDSGDYYSYEYYSDNSYGYAYRRSPDGGGGYDYTYTYYYGNGTTETYDSSTGYYTYGTWDPETFDLHQLENVPTGLTSENYAYDYLQTGTGGTISGILGGTDDIWSATDVGVTSLGNYAGGHGDKGVWGTQVWSWDVLDGTSTTLSGSGFGGAYSGFLGGTLLDDALDGMLVSLYLNPDANLGILLGGLTGEVYPDLAKFAMEGSLNRFEIVNGFGGSPESFDPDFGSLSYSEVSGGLADTGTIQGTGGTGMTVTEGWLESGLGVLSTGLPENPRMAGVWMSTLYGDYDYEGTFDADTTWDLYTEWDSGDIQTVVDGDKWTGGKAEGKVAGAWVDLDNYVTGVMGGELKGTFDADHATWEAVTTGAMLDTETFLAMAGTDAGRSALQAMNIPGFEVGRVNLHGTDATYGDLTVNMWNTTFFAHQSAANAPKIWASGAVTGTNPNARSYINVPVSGGGVNADFYMKGYAAGGDWNAAVNNGTGTVGSYNVAFQGAAAGKAQGGSDPYAGNADIDFSGTASGVVTTASAVTPP